MAKTKVTLTREWTLFGKHWGPGEVEIEDYKGRPAKDVAAALRAAEKRVANEEAPAPKTEVRTPAPSVSGSAAAPNNEDVNGDTNPPAEPTTREDLLALGESRLRKMGEDRGIPGAETMDSEQLADLLAES